MTWGSVPFTRATDVPVLSLKSFHVFFIALAIIITAGLGMWGVLNAHRVFGAWSLVAGASW